MGKILRIGDMHVKVDNLEESERLLQFILDEAIKNKVCRIEFMGDLLHNHAVIRMEVLDFWRRWFDKLSGYFSVLSLCGNHDQNPSKEMEQKMNALQFLDHFDSVNIISYTKVIGNTLYIPHMSSQEMFADTLKQFEHIPTKFLVSHQTYEGSQYESGTYAKDGFDVKLVERFEAVVNGHIHKQQRFANIFCIGTPRWDTSGDCDEKKGIWLFQDDGITADFISTETVCSPIVSAIWKEGDPEPTISDKPNVRTFLTLEGSAAWIVSASKKFAGIRIIPRPTDAKDRRENNASKLATLESYSNDFKFSPEVSAEEVISYIKGQV
jgi:hypothetical protein